MDQFSRTRMLLGQGGVRKLQESRVAVFGIGGVGGYACEALVRSGIGAIDLFDNDTVSVTNLNRQMIATQDTLGLPKVEAMARRLLSICPQVRVRAHRMFYLPENADSVDLSAYDYVVDAIDTVAAKVELAVRAGRGGVPLISALGAGNRLDPSQLRIADIFGTSGCPLARVMRHELRKRGVSHLTVAYSLEPPLRPLEPPEDEEKTSLRRDIPGSAIFVPAAMGLLIASHVVRDLTGRPAPAD